MPGRSRGRPPPRSEIETGVCRNRLSVGLIVRPRRRVDHEPGQDQSLDEPGWTIELPAEIGLRDGHAGRHVLVQDAPGRLREVAVGERQARQHADALGRRAEQVEIEPLIGLLAVQAARPGRGEVGDAHGASGGGKPYRKAQLARTSPTDRAC